MTYKDTIIVGVNSTADHVEVLYHPAGSKLGDKPFQVFVTPHQNHVHVHFGNMGAKLLRPDKTCANAVNLLLNDKE